MKTKNDHCIDFFFFCLFIFFASLFLFHNSCFAANAGVNAVNDFIKTLYTCINYIGYILLIFGIGMIILSFKTENPEAVQKYIVVVCVAATLLGLSHMNLLKTSGVTTKSMVTNIADVLFKVFSYIGYIFIIYGVGQFALSMRNEDAESKSKAISLLVVGAVITGLKGIIGSLF